MVDGFTVWLVRLFHQKQWKQKNVSNNCFWRITLYDVHCALYMASFQWMWPHFWAMTFLFFFPFCFLSPELINKMTSSYFIVVAFYFSMRKNAFQVFCVTKKNDFFQSGIESASNAALSHKKTKMKKMYRWVLLFFLKILLWIISCAI